MEEIIEPKVPSAETDYLSGLVGLKITSMTRRTIGPIQELVDDYDIDPQDLFSLADGTLVVQLNNGQTTAFDVEPRQNSVVVWEVGTNETADHDSEFDDGCSVHASAFSLWSRHLNQKIAFFEVLERSPKAARFEDQPREAGLVIGLDDGSEFLVTCGLHDDSNDISVIHRPEIHVDLTPHLRVKLRIDQSHASARQL